MSRSPKAERAKQALDEYVAGWHAIFRLLREGRSWSGNERNNALLNCGGRRFVDASAVTGLDFADDGRAFSVVDWDQDGDLDLWLYNRTGPRLRLMINQSGGSGDANSSVAFQLRGTRSNRDAVGARVEVELKGGAGAVLAETLYAGDGYLSQSSKWLHFGLGRRPEIGRVAVRWPGGRTETFSGVVPGRRYLLVEGSGEAVEQKSRRQVTLEPAAQTPPRPSSASRVFLPLRVPLPELRYTAFTAAGEAASTRRVETGGRPLLINFWASWCLPCVGELRELAERADEIRGSGLDVLALTVDGLDEDKGTRPSDARRFLDGIGFPFASGIATPELLEKVLIVEDVLYDRKLPFGVPMSFLLDAEGSLAASYRGQVGMDVLLRDVAGLAGSPEEWHELSAPLAGRWQARLPGVDLLWVARKFKERFPGDAEDLLELALHRSAALRDGADSREAPKRLAEKEATVLTDLAELSFKKGRADESIARLRRAVELQPGLALARNNLAQLLRESGRPAEAIYHYRQAVAADPNDAEAHFGLGITLLARRDVERAYYHLEEASRLMPDSPAPLHTRVWILITFSDPKDEAAVREAIRLGERGAELTGYEDPKMLDALAAAYAEAGRFENAVATARKALEVARSLGDAQVAAQVAMRLGFYERGQPFREGPGPS